MPSLSRSTTTLRLVEDAHHDALAVDARQRHDTQVDVAAVDDQTDAAVLGQALLGDVQLGHDLHARDDAGGHLARHGRDVLQHAVDAEADPHFLAVGREVDVGGAALDRLADDLVDELDDRRVFGALVQRDDLAAVLLLLDQVPRRADDVFEAVQARDQRDDVIGRARPPRAPRGRS